MRPLRLASIAFAAAAAATLVTSADAQQRAPRRPRLDGSADTNDAALYFQLGNERLERNPEQAAAAFYWAARLDPMSPLALYGQYAATLMINPGRLSKYILRDERTMLSPETRALDSLRFRADLIDPFYHRWLEANILVTYALTASRAQGDPFAAGGQALSSVQGERSTNSNTGASRNQVNTNSTINRAEQYFEETDPYSRAGLYYGQNDLRDAIQYYGIALRTRNLDWIWADRARAWYELRQYDSAAANLNRALTARRSTAVASADPERHIFEQYPGWFFALGRIYEDKRDTAKAREAYEHAIAEQDYFAPAMVRLAAIALSQRDTANAVGALRRTIELPLVTYPHLAIAATLLSQLGRNDAAAAAMQRATTLEPMASQGWLMLGKALQATNDTTGALAAYQKFLALAPRDDTMRESATRSMALLRPPGQ